MGGPRPLMVLIAGLTVVATGSAALAACSSHDDRPVVLAASSLRTVLPEAAASIPAPEAVLSFMGSQTVVAQVTAGAPVDVAITAGEAAMAVLLAGGHVENPVELGVARLAIVVAEGNPKSVGGVGDLGRDDVRAVVAGPDVPAGQAARRLLARERVAVAGSERSAAAVVSKVALGEADAGIAYLTDGLVPGVEVLDLEGAEGIPYLAAAVRGSTAGAEWLAALTAGPTRRTLVELLAGSR